MAKYIFKEDYDAQGTNPTPKGYKGASFMLKKTFKKGDVFEGEEIPTNSGIESGSEKRFVVKIITPESVKVYKKDGTNWEGQGVFEVPDSVVTKQQGLGADYPDNTDVAPQTFLEKHKNHLLILGGLVIAYLAYKKFNK